MDDTDPTDAPVRRPRVPDVALPPSGGGAPVPLRVPRTGTAVVLLDDAPDAGAAAYLRQLAEAAPALRDADGRALVVVPASGVVATRDAPAPPVLVDAGGRVRDAVGIAGPAVVVTDQWGEVWHAQARGPDGAWLAVEEVVRWLGYLAIRCAG